ncbi:MAG: MGMT family protein, partial [Peptococcaceae bacterium]|nr:MGMT family protein [Peptococcaceae bacterium]
MKDHVYAILKTIPAGYVMTYGQVAERLGNKNLARTVGNILHD